jgi:hypothetical protein
MKTYVYGWKNVKSGMMYIGYKSPDGADWELYISSAGDDSPFWKDYKEGLLEKVTLFEGDEGQIDTAKTLEWFALKYGFNTRPNMFYNYKNNAHCVDESLLTVKIKQNVIDYIDGNSNGIEKRDSYIDDKEIVERISVDIISGNKYKIFEEPIVTVKEFLSNQVRAQQIDLGHVAKIKQKMIEQPARAKQEFTPIVVVVESDGSRKIVDGHNRFAAVRQVKGWEKVPVVYVPQEDFGADSKTRQQNYDLFGLYENRESFVLKKSNSKEDLKRNIENFIYEENLDLSKYYHVERARQLIYDRFEIVCSSKSQLNGILNSILSDFNKEQAELTYQKPLIIYSDAQLQQYTWNKYEKNDIATVCVSVSQAAHGKALGYIQRRMKNVKLKQGAIVLHYTSKSELVNEYNDPWIPDLLDTIKFNELNITVDLLPAFDD